MKFSPWLSPLLLAALTACSQSWKHLPESLRPDPRSAGERAYRAEDFAAATTQLGVAVQNPVYQLDGKLLLQLSRAEEITGAFEAALTHARLCQEIADRRSDLRLSSGCTNMISRAYRRLGARTAAQGAAERALELASAADDPARLSESHANIAFAHPRTGESDRVLEHLQKALQLGEAAGDFARVSSALNGIGNVQRRHGRYEEARAVLRRAVAAAEKAQKRLPKARALANHCSLSQVLGERDRADRQCRQALELAEELGAKPLEANLLNALATLRLQTSRRAALRYYKRSAKLKKGLGDRGGYARSLNNIGHVYGSMNRPRKAERALEASLEIKRELDDFAGQAATLGNLGRISSQRGEFATATARYRKALAIQIAADDPEGAWRTYDNLSLAYAKRRQVSAAIYFGKKAVETIQGVRAANALLDPESLRTYVRERTDVYRRLARLLIRAGRLVEAEQILELLKEQEHHAYQTRNSGSSELDPPVFNEGEKKTNQSEESITEDLIEIAADYFSLSARAPLEGADAERLRILEAAWEKAEAKFFERVDQIDASLAGASRDVLDSDLETLRAFQGTLSEIGENAAAVYLLPGPNGFETLLVPGRLDAPFLAESASVDQESLFEAVSEFRDVVQNPARDPLPLAKQLYDALLKPISGHLDRLQVETLLVYLDRDLRYLPIAALHDGERYVAQRWEVVVHTPAGKDKLRDARKAWTIAAMGVSKKFEGVGTTDAPRVFEALPAVPGELDAIVRETDRESDTEGVLNGIRRIDGDFTPDNLSAALKADFNVIHVASHFRFSLDDASFLVLGGGQVLTVEDLRSRKYQMNGVDLFTLSACETFRGARLGDGAEIEGLSVTLHNQGVKATIATLWNIADESTGIFMKHFYTLREHYGMSKAEALRKTQELFIKGEVSVADGDTITLRGFALSGEFEGETPYAHPFFWAPFVLSGNWL